MPIESPQSLSELRARIRAKDDEILRVVAERLELAREIGAIKMQQQLPIKDDRTEQEVLAHARRSAKQLGVYTELAEQLTGLLMRYAVIAQDENFSRAQALQFKGHGTKRNITIVGGFGRMGLWLADFLAEYGHEITLWDLVPAPSGINHKVAHDFRAAVAAAEVIVLATPISATADMLQTLTNFQSQALIFDICSLKSPLLETIDRARSKGLRVASAHPMFGPDAEVLAGRHIVICETGDLRATEECRALFAVSTARIVTIPLTEHDRLMGQVLGHSHLCNLVFARAMEHSGIAFEDLSAVASTTFAAQLQVTRNVSGENPDLYFEIQHTNTRTAEVMGGIRKALDEYEAVISGGDRGGFIQLMTSGRHFMGSETAKKRS